MSALAPLSSSQPQATFKSKASSKVEEVKTFYEKISQTYAFESFNGQEKRYFWSTGRVIDGKPICTDIAITLRSLPNGDIYLKAHKPSMEGTSKSAFFDYNVTRDGPAVRLEQAKRKEGKYSFEAGILMSLSSPYIVHAYAQEDREKKWVCYLDCCSEGTLGELPKVERSLLLQVLHDTLRGLADLHELEVLHLDLNLGNILMEGGRGLLADFGNARRLSDLNDPEKLKEMHYDRSWTRNDLLTPPEVVEHIAFAVRGVSIEQGKEPAPLTAKADVWSIGYLLLWMWYEFENYLCTTPTERKSFPKCAKVFETIELNGAKDRFTQKKDELLFHLEKIKTEYPAPEDKSSIDYLMWEMLHPNPEKRPSAAEAADKLERFM